MCFLNLLLRGAALIFILIGLFGGLLDVASLVDIPVSRLVAIMIALVLLLVYQELKVMTLSWKLDQTHDLQKRIDKLAEFRQQAIVELYSKTPTQDNFTDWANNFQKWEQSLVNYLQEHFPYAVYEMFEDLGIIPAKSFAHLSQDQFIQNQHLHYLRMIAKHLNVLEQLIQDNTALTKEREPSFRDLLRSLPRG